MRRPGARSHSIVARSHRGSGAVVDMMASMATISREDRTIMAAIWRVFALGVLSTLSMDLMTGVATRLRLIAPLSPNLVGRWFVSVARAHPFHPDIARSAPVSHELLVALPVHYAIGTVLATIFVWATSELGWSPSAGITLGFGLSTSVLPWLLMFPAMGYGLFGINGPEGTKLFVSSLVSHAFFGLGLWIAFHALLIPATSPLRR